MKHSRGGGTVEHRRSELVARPMAWRGILAILFGLFAISGARNSIAALALGFGVYAALEAVAALAAAVRLKNLFLALVAAADGAAAAFFLLVGGLGPMTLSYVLGAWAMLTGILELFAADALESSRKTERAQAAAGAVSMVLGLGLGVYPDIGFENLAGWLGTTMMIFGCLCILAAARVRFDPAGAGRNRSRISRWRPASR